MKEIQETDLRALTRALLAEVDPDDPGVDRVIFRGAQFDHGLAYVQFPEGLGGLGLEPNMQRIVQEELARNTKNAYQDPGANLIGVGMAAPTLATYASAEQQRRLLRPIFACEEIWCQLFSEPGAGSDVSALATRAKRDGDDWVINGQKVWTTLAHVARWGMLLARTDPEQPKHKGLSYFILDMQAPGVEVRPLYQITGEAEFNEIFLSDVRIPHNHMLGAEGEGWQVAITTLMNERVAIGGGSGGGRGRRRLPIDFLLQLWDERRQTLLSSPGGAARHAVLADQVTKLWMESRLLNITNRRAQAGRSQGNPGPEGSVGKLATAELNQKIFEACLDILGPDGLIYQPGYELRRPGGGLADLKDRAMHRFLRSRANTIEGGTSEIMRNILGERVLGLPGEPRDDKHQPWSQSRQVESS